MKEDKFTVTKSNIECFKIRHSSGMYWADITIDCNGNAGRIQIASDFGDWQYYWNACGMPFKDFLAKIEMDYVARKFNAKNYFDAEENILLLKKYILEQRKSGFMDSIDARDAWIDIVKIEDDLSNDASQFYTLLYNTDNLNRILGYDWESRKTYEPGFKGFWKKIWPVLLNEFKNIEVTP